MAAPDPLRGSAEEFSGIDWQQAVKSMEPAGDDTFSKTHGEGKLIGYVSEPRTRGALRFALGFDAVQPAVGTPDAADFVPARLLRTNPVPHPLYPTLFCTSAAAVGLAPDGQGGVQSVKAPGRAGAPQPPENRLGGGVDGFRAKYKRSRLSLRFEPLPYDLQTDIFTTSERERNVIWDQEPRTEMLSLSGFTMTYAEGSNLPVLTHSSPSGKAYPAEVGQVLVKSDCRLTWFGVPERWLMFPGTKKPTRLLARLGTLNSADFFGYARGTLMFSAVKLTRYPWTLRVDPLVPAADAVESTHHYTVEMIFSWFDPPRGFTNPGTGVATPLATTAPNNAGWNCLPWRGHVIPLVRPTDGNAGRWFFSSYDGSPPAAGGKTMFEYSDFTKAFDAAENAPASGV
jgi:hypothetical protein